MPRPNYVEVLYYSIDDRRRRGPKTLACVPNTPDLPPREIAKRMLAGVPGRTHIVEARTVYRRAGTVTPSMSAAEFRTWRKETGFSTNDAAYALAITRRAIQYYESGERPVPGPIAKLCKWIEREKKLGDQSA